jgi:hypothetical protein
MQAWPRTPPPPPSITGPPMVLELLEGCDAVTQITARSGWLQHRRLACAPDSSPVLFWAQGSSWLRWF